MRACLFWLTLAAAAPAQVTIPSGVPLRVALEQRVAIKHVGDPIRGRLIEPIYVFDRVVLPAGSVVEGHIAEIGGVPARRRLAAILSGNLTPPRDVRAQFDSLVLGDGSRLSLRTSLSRGTAHTVRVANRAGIRSFRAPGKLSRLKSTLFGMLPYHRQAWSAGTLFSGVLQQPLIAPAPKQVEAQTAGAAIAEPQAQEVSARLLTPITSATVRKGATVEAIVTQPLFSADHSLLIPESTRLLRGYCQGAARPPLSPQRERPFRLPSNPTAGRRPQSIQGYLQDVEADYDAHLALDSEGAAHVRSPKTRFIFPALAIAAAGLSFHQDYNAQGVPDQDIAGRAESGAVGLGLIGTLLAQTSRTLASSIAFTGAGFSVYSTFIARGQDAVLPANTPLTISLKSRGGPTPR